MFSGNFHTAVQNLRRSKWRTIFTMLGIVIGITSVSTVVSLGEGLKYQITGQINQLGSDVITVRPGKLFSKSADGTGLNLYALLAPSTLTAKDVQSIRELNEVRGVTPVEFITSSAKSNKGQFDNLFVAGTGPNFADTVHQEVKYGGYFSDEDSSGNFAVIGRDVALNMFGVLNPVGGTLTIMGQDFIVRGVLAPTEGGLLSVGQADYNSSIFIPAKTAEELTAGRTNILQILVQIKKGTNIDRGVTAITAAVAKNHGGVVDFTVLKQNQLVGVTSQVLNTTTGFVGSIAAISLLVGGIGIMNIMLVSVTERTREIGIRKAIGATNRQIRRQFLTEGLVLSLSAGVIGVAVSLLINLLLRIYSNWKPVVSVWVILLAVGVSVAAGLVFSLIPAIKAARKDPIAALRGE